MSQAARPADERLPLTRLIPLAVQHVLVMYAGAVAVPLIVGGTLKLPRDQVAMLINADLFACGIATLIQSFGVGWFGIRLPVMMGVTFASVSPMLAMAADPQLGLLGIYGAVIVAGLFGMLVAPFVSRMLPFFPSVVTGSIITVIGITLMRVGIDWAGGGAVAKDYGNPQKLAIALVVLLVILGILRFTRGFLQNIAVLIGIVAGYVITVALGMSDLSGFGAQSWLAPVLPFQFGFPTFNLVACISMCLVMIVVMIESTGMFLALGEITGSPVTQADLTRGLRADGLGTLIGGVFNTFPYTSFSQNVGLVGVTGIRSRFVCVAGGVIMIVLGLGSAIRAGRRRHRDVRHGRGHRNQDPGRGRLPDPSAQLVHRGGFNRHGDDPAGVATALQPVAARAEADPGQRHPPRLRHRGDAERLFQRRRVSCQAAQGRRRRRP